MTDLMVYTDYGSLDDLAEGFAGRLEAGRIILYGPEAVDAGQRLPFGIFLDDNSAAIEGQATVTAAVDGGEDRDPGARFDIVLEDLQLKDDQHLQNMQHLLDLSPEQEELDAYLAEEEATVLEGPGTTDSHEPWGHMLPESVPEINVAQNDEAGEQVHAEADAARAAARGDKPSQASTPDTEEVFDFKRFSEPPLPDSASATTPDQYTPPGLPQPRWDLPVICGDRNDAPILERPSRRHSWIPALEMSREARPSSGFFDYEAEALPIPKKPARPEEPPANLLHAATDGSKQAKGNRRAAARVAANAQTEASEIEVNSIPAMPIDDDLMMSSLPDEVSEENAAEAR